MPGPDALPGAVSGYTTLLSCSRSPVTNGGSVKARPDEPKHPKLHISPTSKAAAAPPIATVKSMMPIRPVRSYGRGHIGEDGGRGEPGQAQPKPSSKRTAHQPHSGTRADHQAARCRDQTIGDQYRLAPDSVGHEAIGIDSTNIPIEFVDEVMRLAWVEPGGSFCIAPAVYRRRRTQPSPPRNAIAIHFSRTGGKNMGFSNATSASTRLATGSFQESMYVIRIIGKPRQNARS
jgi:hypothetical protein